MRKVVKKTAAMRTILTAAGISKRDWGASSPTLPYVESTIENSR